MYFIIIFIIILLYKRHTNHIFPLFHYVITFSACISSLPWALIDTQTHTCTADINQQFVIGKVVCIDHNGWNPPSFLLIQSSRCGHFNKYHRCLCVCVCFGQFRQTNVIFGEVKSTEVWQKRMVVRRWCHRQPSYPLKFVIIVMGLGKYTYNC